VENPHFLLGAFSVVAASSCSRSGSALNENAGRTQVEQMDPKCAESGTKTTIGKGGEIDTQHQDGKENLSDKLARSEGVICPPVRVDPEIEQPTPPGGNMPVIPPPGSPGGDQSVKPK
jgi:hypothetical protein